MRRLVQTGLATMILLGATLAQAQTVNPRFVEFQSPDHAIVTRYEVGYFLPGAPSPVQTVSIPQAAWVTQPEGYWRHALPRPVLGSFTAKARAFGAAAGGGEVASDWSNDSGPFSLSPVAPAGLRTPQ